jgi:hypothetical protein
VGQKTGDRQHAVDFAVGCQRWEPCGVPRRSDIEDLQETSALGYPQIVEGRQGVEFMFF